MSWNRRVSRIEEQMSLVLSKGALGLPEIVVEIKKTNFNAFMGKTPTKSLYSIIARREKSRLAKGRPTKFLTNKIDGRVMYRLNPEFKESE